LDEAKVTFQTYLQFSKRWSREASESGALGIKLAISEHSDSHKLFEFAGTSWDVLKK
jgi:hypothetical protein